MSTSDLIKKHNAYIKKSLKDKNFSKAHKKALEILKHERFIHLIVTLAVTVLCVAFFALYLFFAIALILIVFFILLVLTIAYFLYYFKLENTVMKWEDIEYKLKSK